MLVVRAGAAGCTSTRGGSEEPVTTPGRAVEAVDVTGAGDTHTGVLAARLAEGAALDDALAAANAAAALSVTRRGPATAPRRDETEQWGLT